MHDHRAYLKAKVKVLELPSDPTEDNTLSISFGAEGETLTVRVYKRARKKQSSKKIVKGWNKVSLWPKTDEEGKLSEETGIRHVFTKDDFEEQGIVIGKLVELKSDQDTIVVEIHPKKQGNLKQEFSLVLKAPSEIIEVCEGFKKNQEVVIDCKVDEDDLGLVVKGIKIAESAEKE